MDLQVAWQRLDEWVQSVVPMPASVTYKALWSTLILLVFLAGRRVITRILVHRAESEQAREVAAEVLPTFLGLSALGALLKVWLNGRGGAWPEVTSTIYVGIFYICARKLAFAVLHLGAVDKGRQYVLSKYAGFLLGTIALGALARIWVIGGGSFSTYLGLLSAGIAIALQDLIASSAGWLYILFVRPFEVGDRVRVGELSGDVVDVRPLNFSIHEIDTKTRGDEPTGKIIHIPNSAVFKGPVTNFNEGFNYIWNEIPVTVTHESDWQAAQTLFEEILTQEIGKTNREAERQFAKASRMLKIRSVHLEPLVWVEAEPNGVTLTLRYLCQPLQRRATASKLWVAILTALKKQKKIELAYPTMRHV